ncbi:MAG: hypothetical protein WBQ17_01835 [Rhizomicrobium sp.]
MAHILAQPSSRHCIHRSFDHADHHRLYALVVLRHLRREIVHTAVTKHPTAEWLARQITEAFPWDSAPTIPLRDNDKVFGEVFRRHASDGNSGSSHHAKIVLAKRLP